jgi:ERCC4-type nuclease
VSVLVKKMEKQKILRPENKVVVICDYREKEVIDSLKNLGAIVNDQALDVGDFICSERACIERKAYSDFVGSIIDGRIFEQVANLKENFAVPVVIIEGYSYNRISDNALKAAIASLLVNYGVSLIASKNPADTAKIIFWIAKKEQAAGKELVIKFGRKPKDLKRLKESMVGGLPGVSVVLARRLLEKFGSVEKVFAASESELQSVEGIGEKLAKKIKNTLTDNY